MHENTNSKTSNNIHETSTTLIALTVTRGTTTSAKLARTTLFCAKICLCVSLLSQWDLKACFVLKLKPQFLQLYNSPDAKRIRRTTARRCCPWTVTSGCFWEGMLVTKTVVGYRRTSMTILCWSQLWRTQHKWMNFRWTRTSGWWWYWPIRILSDDDMDYIKLGRHLEPKPNQIRMQPKVSKSRILHKPFVIFNSSHYI